LAGGVTALQERVVPVDVVPEAARPVGVPGDVAQLVPGVVTPIEEL
jgi:hypothetical protein